MKYENCNMNRKSKQLVIWAIIELLAVGGIWEMRDLPFEAQADWADLRDAKGKKTTVRDYFIL